ncbi:ARF GTPase-activating protein GIT1 isoform X3 [Neocloeon triangulifer]|uniref:ARF GTPase-activating protein GIT1 isoform X3 n=1 Tax=Neocloeon triangulifer TaxID=2078957 RepID=UPI00286F7BD2|nr:ARF GTPase-activating protein GIT1 isoform X3 [Neocloeon triangulifer]
MSVRGKLRGVSDVCGDCGALDPTWASINRGILLCDECCSIHRSLGRHISRVKSLRRGAWTPSQLSMVQTLNSNGANSIWEHSLLDPTHAKTGRKKPQPKDPVHPTKADFIRAKHQMLAFVYRPSREETQSEDADLSRQLHSSVRTVNLETSLRMLAQGADSNFLHPEKGTRPLHVAAKEGQGGQIELLLVYGANPMAGDIMGNTPADVARMSGHPDLANRLIECSYELTDRLAHYLCGRLPDHSNGQHFIVPEMSDNVDHQDLAKAARKRLQDLPNHLFEELATDVYDEVDRRETESIYSSAWAALQPAPWPSPDRSIVPFLPVNPELSATRNQGRQKLARLNAREFAILIIDILSDAKRRQTATALQGKNQLGRRSEVSDDEPLYDSVASDDDYVTAASMDTLSALSAVPSLAQSSSDEKEATPPAVVNPISNGESRVEDLLKKQLACSENRLDTMTQEIRALQATVARLVQSKSNDNIPIQLQTQVSTLIAENTHLRSIIAQAGLNMNRVPNGHDRSPTPTFASRSPRSSIQQRPVSMYEPRTQLQVGQISTGSYSNLSSADPEMWRLDSTAEILPAPEDVKERTDVVTKRIQELWAAMVDNRRELFLPCAVRIRAAVGDLTTIFPNEPQEEPVRNAIQQLTQHSGRLQAECTCLLSPGMSPSLGPEGPNDPSHTLLVQKVRSCAYDIAKATKVLVTHFQV